MTYNVRILLDEIEVEADSPEEAEDIAADVFNGDARTQLDYGLTIMGFETEEAWP